MITDDVGRIAMSSNLGESLARAVGHARAQGHREVSLEHMLLSLAEDPDAGLVLAASNVDVSRLVNDVSGYLGRLEEPGAPSSDGEPEVSSALRRILEAAAAAAKGGRRHEINGAIVLAAIVGDGKSPSAHILQSQGLTFEDAIRAIQHGAGAPAAHKPDSIGTKTDEILASARERVESRAAPGLSTGRGGGAIGEGSRDRALPQVEPQGSQEPVPAEQVAGVADESPPSAAQPEVQPESDEDQAGNAPPTAPAEVSKSPEPALEPLPEPSPVAGPLVMPSSAPFPPPIPIPGAPAQAAPPSWTPPPPPSPAGAHPTDRDHLERESLARAGPAMAEPPAPNPSPPAVAERPGPPPLAPWPEARGPRQAPQRQPMPASRRSDDASAARAGQRSGPSPRAEIGQLAENIPRNMRVAVPVLVEVRIARGDVKALAEGLQGGAAAYQHEVTITKAMSVRLRAPDGGFYIETASPETQWIEKTLLLSSDDFASWRWNVTPREKGKKRLQLVISARTVGADGLAEETALPDQVITIRVRTNYAKSMSLWAGWVIAALAGGLLARFGEGVYDAGLQLFATLMAI